MPYFSQWVDTEHVEMTKQLALAKNHSDAMQHKQMNKCITDMVNEEKYVRRLHWDGALVHFKAKLHVSIHFFCTLSICCIKKT